MEVLGVLSGVGHLPVEVARSAKELGYHVVAVGVVPGIDEELPGSVDVYYDINIGKIGKNCHFFPGCSIGAVPQDLKFVGEKSYTIIGDGGSFRECCTVHRACGEGNETRIGNNILMMAYTHVAHNCIVGNNVIMSNVATLAGHVIVEDRAVIGGLSAVHQFCKIGRNAMIGGMARVTQDVPPFMICAGDPAFVSGLNSVGLSRAGMPVEERSELKKAFRILYRSGLPLQEAISTMEQELTSSEPMEHLMRFLRNVERGIIRTRRG